MSNKMSGVAIATAAAALFAAGTLIAPSVSAAESAPVHCAGINACKGQSECKTAKSDCKGMNSCKGQGWVHKASSKECTDAGGKVAK
jgi:curli biogenesis system outer membrane secretion channel CsgG